MQLLLKQKTILPGFGLSLGISVFCLSLLVLLPFAMLIFVTSGMGWSAFISTIADERVLAAILLSLRLFALRYVDKFVFWHPSGLGISAL